MFKSSEKLLPTPQLIIEEVANYYNKSESAIRGTGRDKVTVEARQMSMYLIRRMTNLPYEDIALEYGKDHTTVMHSVNKIEGSITSSDTLKNIAKEITTNVNNRL